jgi:hypothetical protein
MRALGRLTSVLITGVAIVAVAVGLRSIPDVRRYLKMRSM